MTSSVEVSCDFAMLELVALRKAVADGDSQRQKQVLKRLELLTSWIYDAHMRELDGSSSD